MTNTTEMIKMFADGTCLKNSELFIMQSCGLIEEVPVEGGYVGWQLTEMARRVLRPDNAGKLEVRRQPSKLR